jgi:hypothetical protein
MTLTVALLLATACSDDGDEGSGTLSVLLEAEDTITDGLDPGDDVENVRDGWQLRFDRYVLAVGDIAVRFATDGSLRADAADVFVVDLTRVPASGLPLWELPGLRAGRWEFGYSLAGAAGAIQHESVSAADFEAMRAADATYLVAGTISQSEGRSCPPPGLAAPGSATPSGTNASGQTCYANPTLTLEWLVPAKTSFGPCELDGVPGFSLSAGSTQTVAATLHGDHLTFNGFPEGDEGGVLRLVQWLADCDLNVDGAVTRDELEAIPPSALAELDARFQLGGSPIQPLDSMWTYVVAQLSTQGHMNGEGECPLTLP